MRGEERTITLPVSGTVAVIREGDGNAERILYGRGDVVDKLPAYWAALTSRVGDCDQVTSDVILDLLVPDQEFLAIEIYRLSYGDELELTVTCAKCGKAADYVTDLGSLPMRRLPDGVTGPDPTFTVELPRTRKTVMWGFARGRDEWADVKADFDPNRMDWRAIRTLDGAAVSYEDVRRLPLADHRALRRAIAEMRAGYDPNVRFVCREPGCAGVTTLNVLSDPSFLFPGFPSR